MATCLTKGDVIFCPLPASERKGMFKYFVNVGKRHYLINQIIGVAELLCHKVSPVGMVTSGSQ